MRAAAAQPLHLRTGLAPLDAALFGGLPAGSVTEARRAWLLSGWLGWVAGMHRRQWLTAAGLGACRPH